MKIGDIVVLLEDHNFIGIEYKKGTRFEIIGDSGFRGWDIQHCESGAKIYETAMSSDKYVALSKLRDDKLKELGL